LKIRGIFERFFEQFVRNYKKFKRFGENNGMKGKIIE
jgi:hypothetical protein